MTITSARFLAFFFVSIVVFFVCPVKRRWLVLLAGSIYFYVVAGALKFLPFLVFTSAVVWLCARQIGLLYEEQDEALRAPGMDRKAKKEIKEGYKKRAKRFLLLALVLCIGFLCVTKFTRYAVRYLNLIALSLNGSEPFHAKWLLVPLGISYYTFSTVGYLLDVYWKRYAYEKNFFRFFLYAIYFPHIVQGPISRYNLLGQELKKELRFDAKRVIFGLELMLWGYFKKLVIADRLNIFVSAVFDGQPHSGTIFVVAMFLDVFQIYTDFSGYTDIVRGVSQVFGVELEQNFNHPFFSKTVPEFWRRWHMTLGGWFKDYVYYPCTISGPVKRLSKKVKKAYSDRMARFLVVVIPVFTTWILTGLWHGTGKTYLCWGLYYGTLITISVAFAPEFQMLTQRLHIRTDCFSWRLFQMTRTFLCFMGGRLLTVPNGLRRTLQVIKSIFTDPQPWQLTDGSLYTFGLGSRSFLLIAVCLLILWAVSMMQERFSIREKLAEQNIVFRWAVIYLAIFAILIFGVYGLGYDASAFLYEQY
ncbi:MBOAT family O-acyltransferase [Parablautia sp. Marseille-Q6255]|uniref:MBOAT family O-acyltransferase n=1 Tax=Parablautia sp. Marseille-Q6255 TaxID=3039593 RepID=UPI0024BC6B55|nr:MBOAT family O-acyltransferase [Parablautia sp. Marseille-Q6255]